MGGGMLKVDPTDIRKMQVLSPDQFKKSILPELKDLLKRPVGSVEEEYAAQDRRIIDDYILGNVLGLSPQEQDEVREAVKDLVKTRLQKAQSLKKVKKNKEGLDVNLLAQNILSHLGEDNIAIFYKNRIAKTSCYSIDLPERAEPIEIEKSLFGWRLKVGRKVIDCSSEVQARYLRVFAEMGWDKAVVPKDSDYLVIIIDLWENLFEKAQAALEEYTSSILQNKTRDLLTHTVWAKLREQMIE